MLSGKSLVLEAIGRFPTQNGTSNGTVSETTKQSKGRLDLKFEQQHDNGGVDLGAGHAT